MTASRAPEFLTTPRKLTGLQETDVRPGQGVQTGGGGLGGFGGGRFTSELPSLQKLGMGFAGEWYAYRWLERYYEVKTMLGEGGRIELGETR